VARSKGFKLWRLFVESRVEMIPFNCLFPEELVISRLEKERFELALLFLSWRLPSRIETRGSRLF